MAWRRSAHLRKRSRLYGLTALAERGLLESSAQEHLELLDALLARDEHTTRAVITRFHGFGTDRYGRAGFPILAMVYVVRLAGTPTAGSDVSEVRWFRRDAIPWRQIGFPSIKRTLRDYLIEIPRTVLPPGDAHRDAVREEIIEDIEFWNVSARVLEVFPAVAPAVLSGLPLRRNQSDSRESKIGSRWSVAAPTAGGMVT